MGAQRGGVGAGQAPEAGGADDDVLVDGCQLLLQCVHGRLLGLRFPLHPVCSVPPPTVVRFCSKTHAVTMEPSHNPA